MVYVIMSIEVFPHLDRQLSNIKPTRSTTSAPLGSLNITLQPNGELAYVQMQSLEYSMVLLQVLELME